MQTANDGRTGRKIGPEGITRHSPGGFAQSLQENARIVLQNQAMIASFQILSNSSFAYHSPIQRYVVLVNEKASLNISYK
jgi:hypothetical protein